MTGQRLSNFVMGSCGFPTFTCVLMLLFMAVLYAGVHSEENGGSAKYSMGIIDSSQDHGANQMEVRAVRSVRGSFLGSSRSPWPEFGQVTGAPRSSGRPENRYRGQGTDRGRRPRPGGNRSVLPPGLNRRTLRLAEKIYNASTPFAARLFRAVTSQSLGNSVISPFSVHIALSMTMLGARGATEREMQNVIGHRRAGLQRKKPHKAYQGMITSLQNVHSEVKLYSANAVFVKPTIAVENAFRQGLNQMYNATFERLQFDHPQGPEHSINSWVSNVTKARIQGLLPPGTVTPLTTLILVNAIYFNASWSKPFTASSTRPDQFNSLSSGTKTVDMMNNVDIYGYANHHNTEVIEILYKGDRLAMYVLLPNPTSNITHLLQESTAERRGSNPLNYMFENIHQENLRLYMPKFRIEASVLDFKHNLQQMGIVKAFQPDQANFSGISTTGDLHIDAVLHKAFIDVNEKGTEGSTAMAAVIGLRSSLPVPVTREVKVDRPFAFVVRDKLLKEILFIGTYTG